MSDELESQETEQPKVFLSYSRKDRERAQGFAEALRSRRFGVFKDTDDILPTEQWRDRLEQLIIEADTIVFLLSPASAVSEVCAWEVELATSLNKRIAPIIIEDVDGADIPPLLSRLNYIFCTPRDPFENAVDTLVSALNTDIEWIREHTRLTTLAARWVRSNRSPRFLLRGQDIIDAERWRDNRPAEAPAVTQHQATLISDSRAAGGRRQRNVVLGACAAAAVGSALAVLAYLQSVEADTQRDIAQANAIEAEANAAEAEAQRDLAETSAAEAERQRIEVSRRLITQSLRAGDFAEAARLMQEIDPDSPSTKMVLASLMSPEEAGRRDTTGLPFLLNDTLYLSQQNAPPIPLALDFSATGWTPMEGSVLLISDSSQVRWISHDGTLLGEVPAVPGARPCGVHRGNDRFTIYSLMNWRWTSNSEVLVVTFVPREPGPITRGEYKNFVNDMIPLDGPGGAYDINTEDLFNACSDSLRTEERSFGYVPVWEDFDTTIRSIDEVAFPGPAAEPSLWDGPAEVDYSGSAMISMLGSMGITQRHFEALGMRVPPDDGPGPNGVQSIQFFPRDRTVMFGIGGGRCLFIPGTVFACPRIGGPRTTHHAYDPVRRVMAIYGSQMTRWGTGRGRTGSLWFFSADMTAHGGDLQERIRSAAFNTEGHLAVLETGALIILDAEQSEIYRRPLPRGARAVSWLPDGRLILVGRDGVHVGAHPGELEFTPLLAPELPRHFYIDENTWIAPPSSGSVVALGYWNRVVLFDADYMAPVSGMFEVPHRHVQNGRQLSTDPNGLVRLTVSGLNYIRRGLIDPLDARYLDPAAVFE
ncbi:MAG: toll/interleukin-1 receptor domain-containing protein [Pseudomonadota bacterium]